MFSPLTKAEGTHVIQASHSRMDTDKLQLLIPLAAVTWFCGYEIYRCASGHRHRAARASRRFGYFVSATSFLAIFAYFGCVGLLAARLGIMVSVITCIASILIGSGMALIAGADKPWKCFLSLLLIWPLTIALYVVVLKS